MISYIPNSIVSLKTDNCIVDERLVKRNNRIRFVFFFLIICVPRDYQGFHLHRLRFLSVKSVKRTITYNVYLYFYRVYMGIRNNY